MGAPLVAIVFLLVSSGLVGFLAVYSMVKCDVPGSRSFAGLMAGIALYAFGYAFELISHTLDDMLFWDRVECLGIGTLPAFWLVFTMIYSGRERSLRPRVLGLLFGASALTIVLHYTDAFHGLYYRAVSVNPAPFPYLAVVPGPWYLVHFLYIFGSLIAGIVMLFGFFRRSKSLFRPQAVVMITAAVVSLVAIVIHLSGTGPEGIDATPFGLSVSGFFFFLALFRLRFLELTPIARERVVEEMGVGFLVIGNHGAVIDYNRAAGDILGLTREVVGRLSVEVLTTIPDLRDQVAGDSPLGGFSITCNGVQRHYRSRLSELRSVRGTFIGTVVVISDETENVLMMDRLRTLAATDDLTGVFNRRHFFEDGSREFERARRAERPLTVLIIDLDFFKSVNDSWGHAVGDRVLKEVADRCRSVLRTSDSFCRYGGEEFAAVLPETDSGEGLEIAERIRIAVSADPIDPVSGVAITASIGIYGSTPHTDDSLDEYLRKADDALYRAKDAGRNTVWVYTPG